MLEWFIGCLDMILVGWIRFRGFELLGNYLEVGYLGLARRE